MDKIIAVITVIISIIGGFYSIYKKIDSQYEEYLKIYYKNILEPFYYKCIIKNKNTYDFFREDQLISKYFQVLPTYIHKLVKDDSEDSEDKLYKIMCVDFSENRPSKNNSIMKSIKSIMNVGDYIVFLIFMIIIPAITMLVFIAAVQSSINLIHTSINGIKSTVNIGGMLINQHFFNFAFLILGVIAIFIILKLVISTMKEHTYSLNKNNVNKVINNKLKQYKNFGEDLFH